MCTKKFSKPVYSKWKKKNVAPRKDRFPSTAPAQENPGWISPSAERSCRSSRVHPWARTPYLKEKLAMPAASNKHRPLQAALEALLFDRPCIWRHFDLGILEADDVLHNCVGPTIPRREIAKCWCRFTNRFLSGVEWDRSDHQQVPFLARDGSFLGGRKVKKFRSADSWRFFYGLPTQKTVAKGQTVSGLWICKAISIFIINTWNVMEGDLFWVRGAISLYADVGSVWFCVDLALQDSLGFWLQNKKQRFPRFEDPQVQHFTSCYKTRSGEDLAESWSPKRKKIPSICSHWH